MGANEGSIGGGMHPCAPALVVGYTAKKRTDLEISFKDGEGTATCKPNELT